MAMPDDAAIGAQFRAYIRWWASGGRADIEDLFDAIAGSDQTGFPAEPALDALSRVPARNLWKTFENEDLQDLYDLAQEAGLRAAAANFLEAVRQAPVLDDGKIPIRLREQALERAGYRCQICGATEHLSIDHKVVPWSEGGSSRDLDNLQVLCISCNSRKGARPLAVALKAPTKATRRAVKRAARTTP